MPGKIVCLFALFLAVGSVPLGLNKPKILETDTPPCSNNASNAYVDVILVIDTSANMGNANLRKVSSAISLALSKFTIGNQVDITMGYRNTRVSIVTYDTQATIVANYTDINNYNDVARIVSGLSVSNSQDANLYDGLLKAWYIQTNCTDPNDCSVTYTYIRPTAMILFSAAANSRSVSLIPDFVGEIDFFDDGTLISVNFNPSNQALTNLLANITWNYQINSTMYNFLGSSNSITKDLEWAITQANCYCDSLGENFVYYDSSNKRYTRVAECAILDLWEGGSYPNDTINMCQWESYEYVIPAFVLSSAKMQYIQSYWSAINPFTGTNDYPFYFGLHQNSQGQWAFYDYNRNEFLLSSFTAWGQGYPNGTDGCAIIDADANGNFVWKSYGCNTDATGLSSVLCQGRACDIDHMYCCANCNAQGTLKTSRQKVYGKNRRPRGPKKIDRKNA